MELSIRSNKFHRNIVFSRPGRSRIYINLNGEEGTAGNPICQGGLLIGIPLTYVGESSKAFERLCRGWYHKFLLNCRDFESILKMNPSLGGSTIPQKYIGI